MEIKDYLHLYLGCQLFGTYNDASGSRGYLTGVTNGGTECEIQFILEDGINVEEKPVFNTIDEVKLILRPFNAITPEEVRECIQEPHLTATLCKEIVKYGLYDFLYKYGKTDSIPYLLSKGFDLFSLIPNGLAIDLETIKQ